MILGEPLSFSTVNAHSSHSYASSLARLLLHEPLKGISQSHLLSYLKLHLQQQEHFFLITLWHLDLTASGSTSLFTVFRRSSYCACTLSRRVSLPLLSLLPVPGIGLFLISASRSHASFIKDSRMLAKTQLTYIRVLSLSFIRKNFPKEGVLKDCMLWKGTIGEWKRSHRSADDKLNSALLLKVVGLIQRDSWNFCGLRWKSAS
ncbi:hypothetical protein Leryth_024565 [Lithospermum erythrorhizon]|nr:hypothetical protein Leryth_024565 [Lithospermum erythrorhizon]